MVVEEEEMSRWWRGAPAVGVCSPPSPGHPTGQRWRTRQTHLGEKEEKKEGGGGGGEGGGGEGGGGEGGRRSYEELTTHDAVHGEWLEGGQEHPGTQLDTLLIIYF